MGDREGFARGWGGGSGYPRRAKRQKHFHEGPRRTAKGHEGVGGGSRGLRQRSPRGERISTKRQKHELFSKFATGQVILPANVMFCLFQYRVRPGEKCGFTTKSTKVRAFCKIPQARVLWVGRGDREFEEQVRSLPEWPQEAQMLEWAGLKSYFGIRVHSTRLSVEPPQKAQKRDWARREPYFVTFVLFVVKPFTTFAGQRELSRVKPGERSLAGPVRSLLFHGDARFRILQKAHFCI